MGDCISTAYLQKSMWKKDRVFCSMSTDRSDEKRNDCEDDDLVQKATYSRPYVTKHNKMKTDVFTQ